MIRTHRQTPGPARRRVARRGFNLVELLIALSITAMLMAAVMVALHASFMAYQSTTEVASTQAIGRLIMHRMMTLIRTGEEFGPFPVNPNDTIVESDDIEILIRPDGPDGPAKVFHMEWVATPDATHPQGNALYVDVDSGTPQLMLEGVIAATDSAGNPIKPFTLEYLSGWRLYRATIDLTIVPDDNLSTTVDGVNTQQLRMVASAMPRLTAYDTDF